MSTAAVTSLVAGAAAGLAAWGAYDPRSPLFGPVIGRGPRDRASLYLSFDDGPNLRATPAILETLAREQVPAAFFVVGRFLRQHARLARELGTSGHEIGNHTQTHPKLHRRGPGRILQELSDCHRAIVELTGRTPRCFRAPHGYRNPFVHLVARTFAYRVVAWTMGVWDSARPGAEVIRERVRTRLMPGAIILLHDGDAYDIQGDRTQTADALPGIIRDARDNGYDFRPLAELLA